MGDSLKLPIPDDVLAVGQIVNFETAREIVDALAANPDAIAALAWRAREQYQLQPCRRCYRWTHSHNRLCGRCLSESDVSGNTVDT